MARKTIRRIKSNKPAMLELIYPDELFSLPNPSLSEFNELRRERRRRK